MERRPSKVFYGEKAFNKKPLTAQQVRWRKDLQYAFFREKAFNRFSMEIWPSAGLQ